MTFLGLFFASLVFQVGKNELSEGADFAVSSLHDLPKVVPQLWKGDVNKVVQTTSSLSLEKREAVLD